MRIAEWGDLEFEGGLNLGTSLSKYKPELVVGNNENTYILSREPIDWGKGYR